MSDKTSLDCSNVKQIADNSTIYNHLVRMVKERCYCRKINRSEYDIITCCDHCGRLSWFNEFVKEVQDE
jgi:hypothetical protein